MLFKGPHQAKNSLSKGPEEPVGVHAQEAGGHHQQGGKHHQVLVRGAIQPKGHFFEAQNCFHKIASLN